jgi:replication-associated recombination protein RarA
MVCISALQKSIRRGLEREAMQFAVELIHTSKPFTSMVAKRLQVISHEDIDTISQPHIVPFVKAACEQALLWYDADPTRVVTMPT